MGILSATSRGVPGRRRLLLVLIGVLAILLCSLPDQGDAEKPTDEYSLKAAFIFNFAKFVDWPESAFRRKGEFCIGTLGRTPLDRGLAELSGRSLHGRTVVIHQLNGYEEAAQCQVLFISRAQMVRVERILDSVKDLPILTIADPDDFCRRGGMLSLEMSHERFVFDVNLHEMQRVGLKPYSQLLKLARKIYGR